MKLEWTKRVLAMTLLLCTTVVVWAGGNQEADSGEKEMVIKMWSKFNHTNPQNTQDEWLAKVIQDFESDTGYIIENTFVPYDKIQSKVNLAVQAGGNVPDISYVDQDIDFYARNGALMDITSFMKKATWYQELGDVALNGVKANDGNYYAIPSLLGGHMLYYWTAAYPDGPPETTEDLLNAGARLAKEGKYAITFKGAEGTGTDMFLFQLVYTFGGAYTDKEGNSIFASKGTVQAIEYLRTLYAKDYAPEVTLSSGFEFETPFKDGTAGALVAGSWSYVYLNPLTSPDGQVFDSGSESVEEAVKAGAMGIADPVAAPGSQPYSNVSGFNGWGIPTGADNVEGAKEFLNYVMEAGKNADYAVAYGGLPTVAGGMEDPRFRESNYWSEVGASINRVGKVTKPNANPKFRTKFNELVVTLIQKPNLDIMTELKKLQDSLNAEL